MGDVLAALHEVQRELAEAEARGDDFSQSRARSRLAALIDGQTLAELLATAKPREPHEGPLRFPVPYYGGKFRAAPLIERAMGPIVNLVIPFGGSLGCLLGRSQPARVETANDKDGLIVNAWRAAKFDPYGVAKRCAYPVHEATLHAVHRRLIETRETLTQRLEADPHAYDLDAAAWWIWGRSVWLGGGWCNGKRCYKRSGGGKRRQKGRPWRTRMSLRGGQTGPGIGQGVLSSAIRDDLPNYLFALAERLRHVRITCGDWSRVVTNAVTISHGITGVYFDPCYALTTGRDAELYGIDEPEASDDVRAWALEHGDHPRLRVVISGLDDEHAELEGHGWHVLDWRGHERMWLSPHCRVSDYGPLFGKAAA